MRRTSISIAVLAMLMILPGWTDHTIATSASSDTVDHTIVWPQPPKDGAGYAYDLQVAGSLLITQSGSTQTQQVALFTGMELRWDRAAGDGSRSARVNLVAPRLTVGGNDKAFEPEPGELITRFDPHSQLVSAQTPTFLRDLGIDLTYVLLGLTIPMPSGPATVGNSWVVRSALGDPDTGQVYDLRTTYTLVSVEPRRQQMLALVRGSLALTPRDSTRRLSYVGRVEAYVDPSTGRVVESATSIDIQGKFDLPSTRPGSPEEASVRTILTAYLLDLGPASARASTEPSKTTVVATGLDQQVVTAPVVAVGQAKTAVTEEKPPATQPLATATKIQRGTVYNDPAGRYALVLPIAWSNEPQRLTTETTTFVGPTPAQMVAVFVEAANEAPIFEFAQEVLAAYIRSSPQFELLTELTPAQLGGAAALAVSYTYPDTDSGAVVGEMALFARYQGQHYVIQYTDEPGKIASELPALVAYFGTALQYGPTPKGTITTEALTNSPTTVYVDTQERFSVEPPAVWPLAQRSQDGSTVTFTELGRNGYLTIYTQPGLTNYTVESVLQAWLNQWSAEESGFKQIRGLEPARLSGLPGSSLSYEWTTLDGRRWRRFVAATIDQGVLYAIVIDYAADGAQERGPVFARIFDSFRVLPTSETQQIPSGPMIGQGVSEPVQPSSASAVLNAAGQISLASEIRLEEPLSNTRVLLIGRLGEQRGQGVHWLSGITVRVKAGQSLYATRTDAQGYFACANVAPLTQGAYVITAAEGPMLGYQEPVNVTLTGVQAPAVASRLVNAGHVIMEVSDTQTLKVLQILPAALTDRYEIERHFLNDYAESGWSSLLRNAIR